MEVFQPFLSRLVRRLSTRRKYLETLIVADAWRSIADAPSWWAECWFVGETLGDYRTPPLFFVTADYKGLRGREICKCSSKGDSLMPADPKEVSDGRNQNRSSSGLS